MQTNLTLTKRPSGWWILGHPFPVVTEPDEWSHEAGDHDIGPYSTKPEADSDRRGLQHFWKTQPEGTIHDSVSLALPHLFPGATKPIRIE